MSYTVFCPTRVVFSEDAAANLADELSAFEAGAILVISDQGIVSAGILERLMPALSAGSRVVELFTGVPGNPGTETVAAALQRARAVAPAAIVAIGGGSAIDVGKAVSVLIGRPEVLWEDLQARTASIAGPGTPLIAVPTTAGTGSEVSHVAVIGAPDGFKRGVVHPALFPAAAIVDPNLALSLPARLTAATGMDAIVHALEAYLGRRANPSMDLLALGALKLAVNALPAAVADGANLTARREMAHAALWAGMAMDQAGLGLCHALCGPLSAHHEVHHGLGNALLLPEVLAFNAPVIPPERWARLRDALGLRDTAQPYALVTWAHSFVSGLGLPTRLEQIGVQPDDLPIIAGEATRMAMIGNNARPAGETDCLAVLRAAF